MKKEKILAEFAQIVKNRTFVLPGELIYKECTIDTSYVGNGEYAINIRFNLGCPIHSDLQAYLSKKEYLSPADALCYIEYAYNINEQYTNRISGYKEQLVTELISIQQQE